MADKTLRKLKREELLEMLIEQEKEAGKLRGQVEELTRKLSDRELVLDHAGTIAEASFQLNGVLEAAQAAAQQYLDNLDGMVQRQEARCAEQEAASQERCEKAEAECRARCEEADRACRERCEEADRASQERCEKAEAACRARCEDLEWNTRIRCEEIERATREQCAQMLRSAQAECDARKRAAADQ